MVVPIGRSDLPPICPAPAPLLVSRGFVQILLERDGELSEAPFDAEGDEA